MKVQKIVEHFYQNIRGWFNFQDIYSSVVSKAADNFHFVEIGTWYGQSAAYMAVEIINSGKMIRFDVVDTWCGSEEHQPDGFASDTNLNTKGSIYADFLHNIAPVAQYVNPIQSTSVEAAKLYPDASLDFVFLDAGHSYEDVCQDLNAWFSKIKYGGYIGGHDYVLDWPGVIKAVQEFPKFKKELLAQVGTSWIYRNL